MQSQVKHRITLGELVWAFDQFIQADGFDGEGSWFETWELSREFKLASDSSNCSNVHGWEISIETIVQILEEENDDEDLINEINANLTAKIYI